MCRRLRSPSAGQGIPREPLASIARRGGRPVEIPHESRGYARDEGVRGDVLGDDRARSHDGSAPNPNAGQNNRPRTDPCAIAYFYRAVNARTEALRRRTNFVIRRDQHHFVAHVYMDADAHNIQ